MVVWRGNNVRTTSTAVWRDCGVIWSGYNFHSLVSLTQSLAKNESWYIAIFVVKTHQSVPIFRTPLTIISQIDDLCLQNGKLHRSEPTVIYNPSYKEQEANLHYGDMYLPKAHWSNKALVSCCTADVYTSCRKFVLFWKASRFPAAGALPF